MPAREACPTAASVEICRVACPPASVGMSENHAHAEPWACHPCLSICGRQATTSFSPLTTRHSPPFLFRSRQSACSCSAWRPAATGLPQIRHQRPPRSRRLRSQPCASLNPRGRPSAAPSSSRASTSRHFRRRLFLRGSPVTYANGTSISETAYGRMLFWPCCTCPKGKRSSNRRRPPSDRPPRRSIRRRPPC